MDRGVLRHQHLNPSPHGPACGQLPHSGGILQPLLFLLPNTTVQLLLLNLSLLRYEGGDSSTHTLHEQHCRAAAAPNCDVSSIPLPSPQAPLEHRRDAREHGLGRAWLGGQAVHHPLVS